MPNRISPPPRSRASSWPSDHRVATVPTRRARTTTAARSTLSNARGHRRRQRRRRLPARSLAPCRAACSRWSGRPRSCGCWPRRTSRSGWPRSPSALGLAKGTVHGILRTLEDVGFVEQDQAGGPYRVATEVFRLGWTKLDQNELRSQGDELDRCAGRPDRRVGQGRRLPRRPGRGRPPRLPGRRRHPGAGHRFGGAAARQRTGQGAAGLRSRRGAQRRQSAAARADQPDDHRSGRAAAGTGRRSATSAGPDRSARSSRTSPGSPRRSATAAATWWRWSASRARSTGSATIGCGRGRRWSPR